MLCTFSNVMLSVSCVSCTSTKRKVRRKGLGRRKKKGRRLNDKACVL